MITVAAGVGSAGVWLNGPGVLGNSPRVFEEYAVSVVSEVSVVLKTW